MTPSSSRVSSNKIACPVPGGGVHNSSGLFCPCCEAQNMVAREYAPKTRHKPQITPLRAASQDHPVPTKSVVNTTRTGTITRINQLESPESGLTLINQN